MTRIATVFPFLMLPVLLPLQCDAQFTINITYSGQNGNARKYVDEMESSGIAASIRAIDGCLRYDYFYPADDPEGLLLIDSWESREALDRYHNSPAMQQAAQLREKYALVNRNIQVFRPMNPFSKDDNPPQERVTKSCDD